MRVLVYPGSPDARLADPQLPQLRVDDLGILRGDGIFETVLVADGHARELDKHLDRLERSASMLDLTLPERGAWLHAVRLAIENWPAEAEMALRLVVTRGVEGEAEAGSTAYALGTEVSPVHRRAREDGVAVVTLERGLEPGIAERAPWLLIGSKSVSYAINMAALREAERRGAEDVIFTSGDELLEGPTSTVVLARGRTLYTPPPSVGILPGTTQAALFRAAERLGWTTKIEPVRRADLDEADGVLLASSVRKITRVHTVDGQALGDSRQRHAELAAAYESEYA